MFLVTDSNKPNKRKQKKNREKGKIGGKRGEIKNNLPQLKSVYNQTDNRPYSWIREALDPFSINIFWQIFLQIKG